MKLIAQCTKYTFICFTYSWSTVRLQLVYACKFEIVAIIYWEFMRLGS